MLEYSITQHEDNDRMGKSSLCLHSLKITASLSYDLNRDGIFKGSCVWRHNVWALI